MPYASTRTLLWLVLALLAAPVTLQAQETAPPARVQVAAGGGFLTSGAYFTGPGSLELSNGDALVGALQVSLTVHRSFAVVLGVAHAQPRLQLRGVPLVGLVDVPGGRLWLADAALRGQLVLGRTRRSPVLFAQGGGGLARYALRASVLGTAVDEHATNVALALGAGLALPLTHRFGLELMAKDYLASFTSIRDLEAFGIEGQRAHTVLLLVSGRLGL